MSRAFSRALLMLVLTLAAVAAARSVPYTDGFDYPVGKPNAAGYYDAQDFGVNGHLGEDWNGNGGGNSDLRDPVYAVSNGEVVRSRDYGGGWGNIVMIRHDTPEGIRTSLYAHLDQRQVSEGQGVSRGQQIGTIGTCNGRYYAHLHFEIRLSDSTDAGAGYGSPAQGQTHPSAYIDGRRPPWGEGDIGRGSSERQHFLDCFHRNGGRGGVGNPFNDTHWWGSSTPVVIQDYDGGSYGRGAIIDNEGMSHSTAWCLHGHIWTEYADLGGPDSALHRPLSDECEAAGSPHGSGGRYQRFDGGSGSSTWVGGNGTIYWRRGDGRAFCVYGDVERQYEALGGTGGQMGFPTSEQYGIQYGIAQNFEGGTIRLAPVFAGSLDLPASGAGVRGIVQVSGSARETTGRSRVVAVEIYVDAGAGWERATWAANYDAGSQQFTYQWDSRPWAGKTVRLMARPTDGYYWTDLVHDGIQVGPAWEGAVDAPASGSRVNATVTLSGWARETSGKYPIAAIEVYLEAGTGWQRLTAAADYDAGTGRFSYRWDSRPYVGSTVRLLVRPTAGTAWFDMLVNSLVVDPVQPTALVFHTQPKDVAAGAVIDPPVEVALKDADGNIVESATNSVTLALPAGGVPLGGEPRTVAAVNGIATFTGIHVDKASGTRYRLTASADGLAPATSAPFLVSAGPASSLAFYVQPRHTAAGTAIRPAVQVMVRDVCGNRVSPPRGVTLALADNPERATLTGTLSRTTANGVATFDDLCLDKPGTGYAVFARTDGLPPVTSSAFNVVVGPPARLAFVVHPSPATAGRPITPPVKVAVLDAAGNLVPRSGARVGMAIGTNPKGATLSGATTAVTANGIATFYTLSLDKASGAPYTLVASLDGVPPAISAPFPVRAGTAQKIVFVAPPTSTACGAPFPYAVKVAVADAQGNVVARQGDHITVGLGANPGSALLAGTRTQPAVLGIATFADLSLGKSGVGYTLVARCPGLPSLASAPFDISAGPPARMAFKAQPTSTTAGQALAPAVEVVIQDARGNPVLRPINVTLTLAAGHPGIALNGTRTVVTCDGVARFTNLSIARSSETPYRLIALAAGVPSETSLGFTISTGRPQLLTFLQQPGNTPAGRSIRPSVRVAVQDACHNPIVSPAFTITLTLARNPSEGTLGGTTTATTSGGVAVFGNLTIDRPGERYALRAAITGMASVSKAFDVLPAATAP